MKGLNLDKLKEALDKGEIFEDANKLNEIVKKSETVSDSDLEKRNERVKLSYEKADESELKKQMEEELASEKERMKKREENERNEMVEAQIKFNEQEISIYNEYILNLEKNIEEKKKMVSELESKNEELRKKL
jgi:predicted RNase H-like nuclease (RuvC/YqgF family)